MPKRLVLIASLTAAVSLGSVGEAAATTTTYTCTGSAQSLVIPAGVTSVSYVIKGAGGGNGGQGETAFWGTKDGGGGGTGASYTGTWTVTPGATLAIKVGCKGGNGANKRDGDGGGGGGWGFFTGGSGGNASNRGCGFLCTKSPTGGAGGGGGASGISIGSLSVVAGGGGGGGGGAYWSNGGGAYAADNGTGLANGSNGPKNNPGNGGSGGSGGGGGNAGGGVGGDNGGNGGQNGRSAASSDSAISATIQRSGGAAAAADGSIVLTYFKPITATGLPSGTVGASPISISLSYPDAGHTFECKLDSGAWAACTSPVSLSGLADGSHTWQVRAVDSEGSRSEPLSRTWTVDATPPPAPVLTGAPSGTVGINLVSFGFSSPDKDATLTCSLDGAEFGPCGSSPKLLFGLSEGAHSYRVRATDAYGNSSTKEANWSVDSAAVSSVSGNTGPAKSATSSPNPSGVEGQCALAKVTNPGDLVCWAGQRGVSLISSLGGGGVQIAQPWGFAYCVLMDTGRIKCTGENTNGQFGTGNTTSTPKNATTDPAGTWVETSGITTATQIAFAEQNQVGCAVLADKTVRCWGKDLNGNVTGNPSSSGNILTPTPVTGLNVPVRKVAPQQDATCALTETGTAWCWGRGVWDGNLGRFDRGYGGSAPAQVQAITSGVPKVVCTPDMVTANTTCYAPGCDSSTSLNPPCQFTPAAEVPKTAPLTDLVDISSGSQFSCAVKSDGTVWCWGAANAGQLGDGRSTSYCDDYRTCDYRTQTEGSLQGAVKVAGITNAVKVRSTPFGSCAVLVTGGVTCWGEPGWLGDGSARQTWQTRAWSPNAGVSTFLPTAEAPNIKAVDISVRGPMCATMDNGLLRCWGSQLPFGWALQLKPATIPFGPFTVTAAPEAPIVGTPASPTSSKSASITFKGESGATFQCSLDGAAFTACTSPKALSGLADGTHTFSVTQSNAGGESPVSTVTWMVSSSLSAPTIDSKTVPGTTSKRTASIGFSGPSGATFQCSVDKGPYAPCTSPNEVTVNAAGKHTFSVLAIKDGLIGPAASAEWTVSDVVVDKPVITGAPAGISSSRSATLSFSSATSGVTYVCSQDSALYSPCTSPRTLTGLKDGAVSFSVKALKSGVESDATDVSWTVDGTPPARPALTPSASGFTSPAVGSLTGTIAADSLTVTFAASEAGSSFRCAIDNGAFSACTSPVAMTSLVAGQWRTLRVREVDPRGLEGDISTVRVSRLGTAQPVILGAPTGRVATDSASITFRSATEGATFQCALDGGAFAACTSPRPLGGLADGSRSFRVKAVKDGVESDVATATWTVDTTPPSAPGLTGVPSGSTKSKSASISIGSVEEGATFRCSVDGAPYTACTSPRALSGLSDGAHSIAVTATDTVGNTSSPATAAWTVDTAAPAKPVISGAPSGDTSQVTSSISIVTEAGAALRCSIDSGAWAACASPLELSLATEAAHSLEVKSIDAAGNESDVAKADWTVDLTAPRVTITGTPEGTVTDRSVKIEFTVDQADVVECSLDGAAFATCASPVDVGPLSDGAHKFAVRAKDSAGNNTVVMTDSWTVDGSKPTVPVLAGAPAAATTATDAVIAFTGTAGSTFKCSVDGGAAVDCTSPLSLTGLSEGAHSLSVRQVNAAGTQSDAAVASWTVDRTAPAAPVVNMVSPTVTETTQRTARVGYTTEPGASALCSYNGGAFAACGASPRAFSGLALGTHTLSVKAVDAAGNVGDASTVTWQVVVPAPRILTPASGTKTVVKRTVSGKNTWVMRVGLLFSTGGDTSAAAQFLTVQVAVDSSGRPVSTRPSDSQPAPTAATFTQGVVAWDASGEVFRTSVDAPVWVRVGNRGGRWSAWVRLTQ